MRVNKTKIFETTQFKEALQTLVDNSINPLDSEYWIKRGLTSIEGEKNNLLVQNAWAERAFHGTRFPQAPLFRIRSELNHLGIFRYWNRRERHDNRTLDVNPKAKFLVEPELWYGVIAEQDSYAMSNTTQAGTIAGAKDRLSDRDPQVLFLNKESAKIAL